MAGVVTEGRRSTWRGKCWDCDWQGSYRRSPGAAWHDCDQHEAESPECHKGYVLPKKGGK